MSRRLLSAVTGSAVAAVVFKVGFSSYYLLSAHPNGRLPIVAEIYLLFYAARYLNIRPI
jgi:hypothetical protein